MRRPESRRLASEPEVRRTPASSSRGAGGIRASSGLPRRRATSDTELESPTGTRRRAGARRSWRAPTSGPARARSPPRAARAAPRATRAGGSRAAAQVRRRVRAGAGAGGRRRDGIVYGCDDGAVGAAVPVDEADFRRLHALSGLLANALPHAGGVAPDRDALASPHARHVLDGTLLAAYATLPAALADDLAAAAASTRDAILESIRAYDAALASLL